MEALQLEALSDEWFQHLSALIDAPQAAAPTTCPSFASGMHFTSFLFKLPFFFLPTNEILAFFLLSLIGFLHIYL